MDATFSTFGAPLRRHSPPVTDIFCGAGMIASFSSGTGSKEILSSNTAFAFLSPSLFSPPGAIQKYSPSFGTNVQMSYQA